MGEAVKQAISNIATGAGGTEGPFNIGQVIGLAGGMYGAIQSIQAGRAADAYYRYIAAQQEAQAKAIMDQAHRDSIAFRREISRFEASQLAAGAAQGMAGSQSMLEILSDTASEAARDLAAIKYNAELQAREMRSQAELSRAAGRNARRAAAIDAISTLIGTAGQVADMWYQWKRTSKGGKRDRTYEDLAGSRPVLAP